jgi:hypothetical protein
MDTALSLKTGEHVTAQRAAYITSKDLLLVCPECGEPVFFKKREIPHNTPFFAHYQETNSLKLINACSLRVFGSIFQAASQLLPGISHGQLVDRFQKEFCRELYNSFGRYSKALYEFIRHSRFEKLDKKGYTQLIGEIRSKAPISGLMTEEVDAKQLCFLKEGLDDVCQFLASAYGVWVGNFIYQTAYFVAVVLHPDAIDKDLGRTLYEVGSRRAIFIAEPFRVKRSDLFAAEVLPAKDKRNLVIDQIAATLVSFLILKWRHARKAPKLILGAETVIDAKSGSDGAPVSKTYVRGTKLLERPTAADEPVALVQITRPVTQLRSHQEPLTPLGPKWTPPPGNIGGWRVHGHSHSLPSAPPTNDVLKTRAAATTAPPNSNTRPTSAVIRSWSSTGSPRTIYLPSSVGTDGQIKALYMSEHDPERLRDLIAISAKLTRPSLPLQTRQAVLEWSGTKNPIEAFFLAAYLQVPHTAPDFSDQTLSSKLGEWLAWAQGSPGDSARARPTDS